MPTARPAHPARTEPDQPELLFLEDPISAVIKLEDDGDEDGPAAYREAFAQIWAQALVDRDAAERLRTAWRITSQAAS